MIHRIIEGDVVKGLASLPAKSVHCVITSPPYWGLRDYAVCDCTKTYQGGAHSGYTLLEGHISPRPKGPQIDCPKCQGTGRNMDIAVGQIGLEATPELYVEKMVEVFRGIWRVLRDDGTVWLNLGDSYMAAKNAVPPPQTITAGQRDYPVTVPPNRRDQDGLKLKDLVGIPWRVAFALQRAGWYLRCDIVWSKPNPMPESVTDRPTRAHEYIFLLTKQRVYFYDSEAIREKGAIPAGTHACFASEQALGQNLKVAKPNGWVYTGQRNRRSVWEITTQPYPEAHFATFPETLVEPCIKAGTSERGCCPKCGAPWERMLDNPKIPDELRNRGEDTKMEYHPRQLGGGGKMQEWRDENPPKTVGWKPTCSCNEEPTPCIVLDPFAGSGTVAKVARDLGRSSVGIELNPLYITLIKKRLRVAEQISDAIKYEVVKVA